MCLRYFTNDFLQNKGFLETYLIWVLHIHLIYET